MAVSDEQVFERFPNTLLSQDNFDYYRGLLEHKLLINRCKQDGTWIYPPRPMCPVCWSTDVVPTEVSGRGHVYGFTVLHQGREIEGFDFPHLIAAIELEEQPRLRYLGPIIECEHDEVTEGAEVEMVWIEPGNVPVAAFKLAQS